MGYIEIPVLQTKLAVYHGTSDAVLASGDLQIMQLRKEKSISAFSYRILLTAIKAGEQKLPGFYARFMLSEEELLEYNAVLDVSGTGIMGYIEIPVLQTKHQQTMRIDTVRRTSHQGTVIHPFLNI